MRAPRSILVVLALVLGVAACGGEGGTASGDASTTEASTTSATVAHTPMDTTELVDAFCAKSEELSSLTESIGATGGSNPTKAQEAEMSAIAGEAVQMMMTLQASAAQMLPGDAVRFEECSAIFGGAPDAG